MEGWEKSLHVPYDRLLKRGGGGAAGDCKHVRGWARAVDAATKTVTVALVAGGTEVLPYDVLVLCTGAAGAPPAKPASVHSGSAMAAAAAIRAAVRAASVVAIIGGGPT